MQSFRVKRWESVESPAQEALGGMRSWGIRAPGPGVLLLQEGTGWVLSQDGVRQTIEAKSVVTWDTADWVEYGSTDGGEFKIELYWAADLSEEEWKAIFVEAFGPEALQ